MYERLLVFFVVWLVPQIVTCQITLLDFQDDICSVSRDGKLISLKKEINLRNYKSILHNYAPSFSFSLSPQYSKSLSPITQPDGTIRNYDIHNISISPSITTHIPILFTGGTLSISNSFSFYRNISGYNSYSNYSANFFHINITQPLSFFRSHVWEKKSANASYAISSLETIEDYLRLKKTATNLFFKHLIIEKSIILLENQCRESEEIVHMLNKLSEVGKILHTEVEEANIEKQSKSLQIKKLRNQLNTVNEEIRSILGESSKGGDFNFIIPSYPNQEIINEIELFEVLRIKQDYVLKNSAIAYEYSIAEAKNRKKMLPSIQIGVGSNGSGGNIDEIWTNHKQSYNASISFSIPITDLKENENKLQIANLNYEQIKENNRKSFIQEEIKLREMLCILNENSTYLGLLYKTNELYKTEISIAHKLLCSGNLLFDDFVRIESKLLKNEKDIIETIKIGYELLLDIEYLLLYDLQNNISYIPKS